MRNNYPEMSYKMWVILCIVRHVEIVLAARWKKESSDGMGTGKGVAEPVVTTCGTAFWTG